MIIIKTVDFVKLLKMIFRFIYDFEVLKIHAKARKY